VDATAVPKTLALAGAPNAAKSVTTLRGGDPVEANLGDAVGVFVGERGGVAGANGYEYGEE
jgi:hypothetical protein